MNDNNEPALQAALCSTCGYEYRNPKALGSQVPESRKPCPKCGSKRITFQVKIAETITLRSMLGIKSRRKGEKKPYVEMKSGDDLHRKTGRWSKLTRHIDREKNHYHERITDAETGDVIHETDEPLSEHTGHGSAKSN